jgi:catechol 2,3-dioxygenase-like lactoylglutathione lyase family enzyme
MEDQKPRLHFVDVLRLIALLQMVNGHTLHALLTTRVRHGAFYDGYLYFRGLVSVAFMLAAGLAFYVTVLLREDARSRPAERRRRVARAFEIIAIGFLLRFPLSALLSFDMHVARGALRQLLPVDVLPCIGVSLLVLELVAFVRDRRVVVLGCAALASMAALLTPWASTLPAALPFGVITTWLGPQLGSSFPLLPYAGFVFAGVVLGAIALPVGVATPSRGIGLRLAGASLVLAGSGWIAARVPATLLPAPNPGVHTPSFFLMKLALVALACAALVISLRRLRGLPRPLAVLTRETLGIYVFHLFVLYGFPFALAHRIGQELSLPAALAASGCMITASAGFGLAWHRAKSLQLSRRVWPALRPGLIALSSAWVMLLTLPLAALGGSGSNQRAASVRSVALSVEDLASSERFLVDALGFRREGAERHRSGAELDALTGLRGAYSTSRRLKLGLERIELVHFDLPSGRPSPEDTRSNDLWFQHLALVTSDITRSSNRILARGGRAISSGPQTIPASNAAAGGIRAFYFRGPSRHPLELIYFPPGKGRPRWQAKTPARTLGIDHTAIAVSNTERSRKFYADLLGLRVTGTSFNFGPEQEALSGVPGARVRITGLRGPEGPGIELLEYESPQGGRLSPADTHANDLWSGEITLAVPDLDQRTALLQAAGVRILSSGIRDVRALDLGATRALSVLDPDGHPLCVVE